MADTNGPIKLLFAIQGYGMGTDALDVERVCKIGPPRMQWLNYIYTKDYRNTLFLKLWTLVGFKFI